MIYPTVYQGCTKRNSYLSQDAVVAMEHQALQDHSVWAARAGLQAPGCGQTKPAACLPADLQEAAQRTLKHQVSSLEEDSPGA